VTIWIDADSLPREARQIVGRRAGGSGQGDPIRAVFVANRNLALPAGRNLAAVIVGPAAANRPVSDAASDAAAGDGPVDAGDTDDHIMRSAVPGDIVVTRDIPLAARAIGAGLVALNDRGDLWTADTVRERLSLRDHAAALRQMGAAEPSPRARTYGPRDVKAFADALDRAIVMARRLNPRTSS